MSQEQHHHHHQRRRHHRRQPSTVKALQGDNFDGLKISKIANRSGKNRLCDMKIRLPASWDLKASPLR